MFEINPVGNTIGQVPPFLHIFPDALFASLVELRDAIFLYIRLPLETKSFFYFDLDGQAMGIPTTTSADHMLTLHAMIAYDSILCGSRFDMMNPWSAIGSGWAFKEDVWMRTITAFEYFADDIMRSPPCFDALFKQGKCAFHIDFCKHNGILPGSYIDNQKSPVPAGDEAICRRGTTPIDAAQKIGSARSIRCTNISAPITVGEAGLLSASWVQLSACGVIFDDGPGASPTLCALALLVGYPLI